MTTKILLSLFAAFLAIPASYADVPLTRDVVVSISDAYIPSGFDSNSDAFVVVNGIFPNSCYRMKEAKVDHIGTSLHEVTTYATVTEGMCLMVLVPFNKEVRVGKLTTGEHKVRFMNGDGTYMERALTVE
jgi:hypothetical protein